jgi:hypothetical protein
VPNLDAVIKWFDENSVSYVKRPEQGKMKNVAFIKDPDGYWIEILVRCVKEQPPRRRCGKGVIPTGR